MSFGWDRTDEFFQLVRLHTPQNSQQQQQQGSAASTSIRNRGVATPAGQSRSASSSLEFSVETGETQFSNDARIIGQELNQAGRKLEELHKRESQFAFICFLVFLILRFLYKQLLSIVESSKIARLKFKL